MMRSESESDSSNSLIPSSPRSPERPIYFVQSPSRDSHESDKFSSTQATLVYNSSMELLSSTSFGDHSRPSSASSRVSGPFRFSFLQKGNKKRNDKGWPECNVIQEEGCYDDDLEGDMGFSWQALIALMAFILLFTIFSLIIWGASRPYKAKIVVENLAVNKFNLGVGSDYTGVPTKLVTMNCSLKISVYNPATFFGIHVSSTPIDVIYLEIPIATGQLKYYQPRKSHQIVSVTLQGNKVPLYGAGPSLSASANVGRVPLRLEFSILSRGNVIGKLVRTKHRRHVSCTIVINSANTEPIKVSVNYCIYD